jgi:aminopeptidase N
MNKQQYALKCYRKNYNPPSWLIDQINLTFDIKQRFTSVISTLSIKKNPKAPLAPCVLNGTAKLISIELDGKSLHKKYYKLKNDTLTILHTPEHFDLKIQTEIYPHKNTKLMGLYASGDNLFTQCEPEGFREITYYPDRPDVIALFTTTLIADKKRYPILLSNGNKITSGNISSNRHWAKWQDPYRKPAYLFALVAGNLIATKDKFVKKDGKTIQLEIWTELSDQHKVAHAMSSLKQAMAWDEQQFNLLYDLDIYMIVAVKDFNAGAMENKGLNIFNAKYVLADKSSSTDEELIYVMRVIGHEYFHNWTGNRVTCRDWFQLSLKEGLTVFREQMFCEMLTHAAITRIKDVKVLRIKQFSEDAGPTSHPIRPESYLEINNFYTATVYEKGAEVVRMYQTLLGQENFKRGLALYLKNHDGQAATCDDFIQAMSDASKTNLTQFSRWYKQSGTPCLTISSHYDNRSHTYTLNITQSTSPTADQRKKQPLLIPLVIGLIDNKGHDMVLKCDGNHRYDDRSYLLIIQKPTECFIFKNVPHEPAPSFLRYFSAPIHIKFDWTNEQLAFLMTHDSDLFARWEACQSLMKNILLATYHDQNDTSELYAIFKEAYLASLNDNQIDPAYKALLLDLPSEHDMLAWLDQVDPQKIYQAIQSISNQLATDFSHQWQILFDQTTEQLTKTSHQAIGLRALRNLSLAMLVKSTKNAHRTAKQHFDQASNMTDQMGALLALRDCDSIEQIACMKAFDQYWQSDNLVMDKYFTIIASSKLSTTLKTVKEALKHPAFTLKNPNKIFALLGTFGKNLPIFHAANGSGYRFLAKKIIKIDRINPQAANYLIKTFGCLKKMESKRQQLMKKQLNIILMQPHLSKNVREIAEKIIHQA